MSTNPYMVRLPGSRRRLRHDARAKTSGRPTRSMRERLLMPVLFAPVFMVILDVFIVNVAAPSLRTDLHATASEVQWVVGAYVLTYAISLVTAGRLGDIFGRRRMFRIGVAGFTLASALCAAAPSASTLIAGRLLQGFAGAAMWPQVLSIIQVHFAPSQRRKVLAMQGGIQGLASVTGQIVGGGLIALDFLHLGWRTVFLINVPVGLFALAAAGSVVPESRSESARKLDLPGVALATTTLALIMVPAIEGREAGWPPWVFIALACAVPTAIGFVALERRIAARGGSPLAELRLFRARGFRTATSSVFLLYCIPSFFLLLSLYMQSGLGLDPIETGLAFTPLAIAYAATSLFGPRVRAPWRERLPQIGAFTIAVGLIATILAIEVFDVHTIGVTLIVTMAVMNSGMGIAVPTLIHLAVRDVPSSDAGTAAGIFSTAQQVGNGLGIAILGTVFFSVLGTRTGPLAYGHALSVAMGVQVVIVLVSGTMLTRAARRRRASGSDSVAREAHDLAPAGRAPGVVPAPMLACAATRVGDTLRT
ncbi:MAG: MFS transporter [Solirubrobacteraceae bacterium]